MNLGMTFFAMLMMERIGRRVLMMTTWIGMCSAFATIFVANSLSEGFGFMPQLMANVEVRAW